MDTHNVYYGSMKFSNMDYISWTFNNITFQLTHSSLQKHKHTSNAKKIIKIASEWTELTLYANKRIFATKCK